jgi:zinc protease
MNGMSVKLPLLWILVLYLTTGCAKMNQTEVTRTVLDDGMTVLVQERHSSPVVAIDTWVNTGYFNEPDSLTGISHLLEHMYFKGTTKRKVGQLRDETKNLGGYLNAGTIYEYTHYYTVVPARFVRQALEIQSDALWNSSIDSTELEKEKKVVIQEIKRKLDNPDALAWEKLMELSFDRHPIRRWRMGTPEQVESWSRDQLFDYYKTYYRPDNIILVIVGDVDGEDVLAQVRRLYGSVESRPTELPQVPEEPTQSKLKYRQMKGDITRTYLKMGFHIPGQLHPDFFALDVLAHILGYGRSSRLSRTLVEEKRLASSVSSQASVQKDFGMFIIEAELEAEDLPEARLAIFRRLKEITRQGVSQQELTKAKNVVNFSYLTSIENARGLAENLGFFELYGDYRLAQKYLEGVAGVTPEDVRRVAAKYLVLGNASIMEYRPSAQYDESMTPEGLRADIESGLSGQSVEEGLSTSEESRTAKIIPHASVSRGTGSDVSAQCGARLDRLSCGAALITRENHSLPLVSLGIYFKGGRIRESEKNSGVTRLTLRAGLKGTNKRSAEEILNSIEALGASLDREVEADYFGYLIRVLSGNWEPALEITADVVRNAAFPQAELEKERDLQLAEIDKKKDDMVAYPIGLFYRASFPGHPYGLDSWGSREAVVDLNRQQVEQWRDQHFRGDNMTLVAVGDFDSFRLKQKLEELFRDFGTESRDDAGEPVRTDGPTGRTLAESRNKAQTAQALGFVTCPYREDDFYALKLLQAVASGSGGRFFRQLREKQGLAYSVYGVNESWNEAGVFYAYIATSPGNEEEAKDRLLEEFYKFRDQPVGEDELTLAKNYVDGMYQIYLETNSAQVRQYARAYIIGKGIGDVEQYPERIDQVTREQVMDVAAKYFNPDRLAMGVVRGEK